MSNTKLNQAILRVAKQNPEFRQALQAELDKKAAPLEIEPFDEDQYSWDFTVRILDDAVNDAARMLQRGNDKDAHILTAAIEAAVVHLAGALDGMADLRDVGSQEFGKAAKHLKAAAMPLGRLSTVIRNSIRKKKK